MPENLYTPHSIRTFSGQYVNVFDPDPNTLVIEDIAHALARQCRFGGHLPEHFSVAQHCICCAEQASTRGSKFDALMHDASETYLLDFPKPIKDNMPEYKRIEAGLMIVLADKFKFNPNSLSVKSIDKWQLEREWYDLMLDEPFQQVPRLIPMSFDRAKKTFLQMFAELTTAYL